MGGALTGARTFFGGDAIPPSMATIVDAIEAEVRGDFRAAADAYRGLTDTGSPLDRIGIYQGLARCHEKLGQLAEAGPWRRRAAAGYMALSDEEMPQDERRYLALVESRNAVQDLVGTEGLAEAAVEYASILSENWKGGPEGLTHEGLFGGFFLQGRGDWTAAARYFFDVAEALNEQWTEGGSSDDTLRENATRTYDLAQFAATKAGRPDVAKVAGLRATALRDGPPPAPLGT